MAGSALAVASGILHLFLWEYRGYRQIPTIGPLFAVQAITAIVLGIAALSRRPLAIAATSSMMVATAVGLVITVQIGLFGFQETWQTPWAVTTLVGELAAAAALCASLLLISGPVDGTPGSRRAQRIRS